MRKFRPQLKLKKKELSLMVSPCVYVFKKNGKPIYVGSSRFGIARPFWQNHESPGRRALDEIQVQFFATEKQARKMEQILINRWQPWYNLAMQTFLVPAIVKERFREKMRRVRREALQLKKDTRLRNSIEKKNEEIRKIIAQYRRKGLRGEINLMPIN